MSIACSGRVAVAAQSFRRRCFLPGCSSPGSHGGVDKLDCNLPKRRQVSTVDPNLSRRRTSPPVRAHVAGPETNRAMRQSTIRASRQSDSGVTSSLFLFPRLSASGEKNMLGRPRGRPLLVGGYRGDRSRALDAGIGDGKQQYNDPECVFGLDVGIGDPEPPFMVLHRNESILGLRVRHQNLQGGPPGAAGAPVSISCCKYADLRRA